jgi:hypothetical protein
MAAVEASLVDGKRGRSFNVGLNLQGLRFQMDGGVFLL